MTKEFSNGTVLKTNDSVPEGEIWVNPKTYPKVIKMIDDFIINTEYNTFPTLLCADYNIFPQLPKGYMGDTPHQVKCDKCERWFWTGYHISHGICKNCSKISNHSDEWESLAELYHDKRINFNKS